MHPITATALYAITVITLAHRSTTDSKGGFSNNLCISCENPVLINTDIGEKSFQDRFGLSFTLPIPESVFIRILDERNIKYILYADRNLGQIIPDSISPKILNQKQIYRIYQIYGNRSRSVSEIYQAYVNFNHEIVCIDSVFEYSEY